MTIRDQVLALFQRTNQTLCNDDIRELTKFDFKAVETATRELYHRGLLTREWGQVKAGTRKWRVYDSGRCYYYTLVQKDGFYRVTLTFVLKEDITPSYFAERVAAACFSYYTLKEGEGIEIPGGRLLIRPADKAEIPDPTLKCVRCGSQGFPASTTGTGCTFCDGTEGGHQPQEQSLEALASLFNKHWQECGNHSLPCPTCTELLDAAHSRFNGLLYGEQR